MTSKCEQFERDLDLISNAYFVLGTLWISGDGNSSVQKIDEAQKRCDQLVSRFKDIWGPKYDT